MSKTSVEQLQAEIDAILTRARYESDLSYAETIGVLELVKADMIFEAQEIAQDDAEEDE